MGEAGSGAEEGVQAGQEQREVRQARHGDEVGNGRGGMGDVERDRGRPELLLDLHCAAGGEYLFIRGSKSSVSRVVKKERKEGKGPVSCGPSNLVSPISACLVIIPCG